MTALMVAGVAVLGVMVAWPLSGSTVRPAVIVTAVIMPVPVWVTVVIQAIAWPVPVVVKPRPEQQTGTEGEEWLNPRSLLLHIHNIGIVGRDVDDVRLGWHDSEVLPLRHYLLLRGVGQSASSLGLRSQLLDRVHHVRALVYEGLPQRGRPFHVVIHVGQDFGVAGD
jgi:hypothetical protein